MEDVTQTDALSVAEKELRDALESVAHTFGQNEAAMRRIHRYMEKPRDIRGLDIDEMKSDAEELKEVLDALMRWKRAGDGFVRAIGIHAAAQRKTA